MVFRLFMNHEKLALIFGLLGNIISFMVFLAPVPTFYKIHKKKSSQGFHSIPYVTALMSAMLLLYYGVLKTNATLIITINAIGCGIEVLYLSIYLLYSPNRELSTLKFVCMQRNVIKTKSVEYMPFSLSLFLTLCATAWFFYGLLVNDYYIALPNVLGFLFGITQMVLYMIYKDAIPPVADKDQEPKQDQQEHNINMNNNGGLVIQMGAKDKQNN
ncbi:Bidirectional sugar transporter NEC1 [Linum perenne]